jgi:hypothetical protein
MRSFFSGSKYPYAKESHDKTMKVRLKEEKLTEEFHREINKESMKKCMRGESKEFNTAMEKIHEAIEVGSFEVLLKKPTPGEYYSTNCLEEMGYEIEYRMTNVNKVTW